MASPRTLLGALLLVVLLAGCAPASRTLGSAPSAPPEAIWQQGPDGWVYGRSPLHLWPAGFFHPGITRLPDRVVFRPGVADLDRNGRQVVLLQGQRLRQLPNHQITLFCHWSSAEARLMNEPALRALAARRCQAVTEVYRDLGVRVTQIGQRLVGPEPGLEGDLQSSVQVTAVPLGLGRGTFELPERLPDNPMLGDLGGNTAFGRYDGYQGLYLPEAVYFDWGSAELDANARALLRSFADWIHPNTEFMVFLNCDQARSERPADTERAALARDRCAAVKAFLVERGLCEDRLINGPGGRHVISFYTGNHFTDEYAIGAWMDQTLVPPNDPDWPPCTLPDVTPD